MDIFDNFGVLKSVLKFHIFHIFNCEESVRIRLICEGLVRFFLRCEELVLNWEGGGIITHIGNLLTCL